MNKKNTKLHTRISHWNWIWFWCLHHHNSRITDERERERKVQCKQIISKENLHSLYTQTAYVYICVNIRPEFHQLSFCETTHSPILCCIQTDFCIRNTRTHTKTQTRSHSHKREIISFVFCIQFLMSATRRFCHRRNGCTQTACNGHPEPSHAKYTYMNRGTSSSSNITDKMLRYRVYYRHSAMT